MMRYLQQIGLALAFVVGLLPSVAQAQTVTVSADRFRLNTGLVQITSGTGSPEGVRTAPVGSIYLRTDGGTGTTMYRKETGTGNTGWVAVASSGTVTSVGLTMPGIFSVSGSPVTSSGTLAVTLANQSANLTFAGPASGGAAAPTFRALVNGDLPTVDPAHGACGWTTVTANGVVYGNGTGTCLVTAQGGANTVLTANTGPPSWTTTPTITTLTATTSLVSPRLTSGGNNLIDPAGDIITAPSGFDIFPLVNFETNIGGPTLMYKSLSVGELIAQTLVAQDVIATIGGRIMVLPTTKLTSNLAAAGTSIVVEHNQMASGDLVLMQTAPGGVPQFEWMAITSGPSGSGGGGPIAYVNRSEINGNVSAGATSSCATTAISHTAGNTLFLFISKQSATAVTVANTASDTWTKVGSSVTPNSNILEIWYATNIAGHGSDVVTATLTSGTAAYFACSVRQFSGVLTASPLDDEDGDTGSGTAIASPSLTVSVASAVIVAMMEADGGSYTAGSGYSLTTFSGASGVYFADEYKIVSASEAATATVATGGWGIKAAAFKVATGGSGPYTYTVTRNLDGTGANDWYAGDAVANTGTTGKGFIDIYSLSGVLSGSGPSIVGNVRTGSTYSAVETRWAIGNLNGTYGYGTDIYGAAFGSPSGAWVKVDPTNGVRIGFNTTTFSQMDASGNMTLTGVITAQAGGSIGGFNIGADYLRDAANSMGFKSTVTGGNDCRIWAGDTFANCATAPFHVSENGALVATSGAIGGWTLGTTSLVSGSGGTTVGLDSGGTNPAIYAGSATPGSAPFRVTNAGALTATNATITGAITATSGSFTGSVTTASGTIGGWTLGATSLTSGSGATTVGIDSGGSNPAFYAGSATPASAPFRVSNAGAITAVDGHIGGWILTTDLLIGGTGTSTVVLNSAVAGVAAMWAGTNSAYFLAPFQVHFDGTLVASNAYITGQVTSTSGTIGGWALAANSLSSGSGSTTVAMDSGGTNPAFYAGSSTPGSAPFRVSNAGEMTALSGSVGGWEIGSDYLRNSANTFGFASTVTAGDDTRIWSGDTFANRDEAHFRISQNGTIWMSSVSQLQMGVDNAGVTCDGSTEATNLHHTSPMVRLQSLGGSGSCLISGMEVPDLSHGEARNHLTFVTNSTGHIVVCMPEDTTEGTAARRFSAAGCSIPVGGASVFIYDTLDQRWRAVQ